MDGGSSMTDDAPEPGGAQPADAPPSAVTRAGSSGLQDYVTKNSGRYTDEAIIAELIRAGYAPDDVRAAVAAASGRSGSAPNRRAVQAVIAAYLLTFAILGVGMLLNAHRPTSEFMPDAAGGITVLGISLGVALGLSLVWIASRRIFFVVVAALLVGGPLTSAGGGGGLSIIGVLLILVAGVWLLRRPARPGGHGPTALGVLLAMPILLLLVVGGICVASGLPIPRAG
jgi:hypothetical protein